MPEAVRLYRAAVLHLKSLGPHAFRLVLSLFFKAVLGIQRVFHFETLDDPGFAILTGGSRVLSRNMLGGLIRAAPVRGVFRFAHATEPSVKQSNSISVSIDEHSVARFTKKFSIRKGFHTIRNKHMKIEKLSFSFNIAARQLLSLVVTRGNAKLVDITQTLLKRLRRRARGATIRLILDAGAAQNHGDLLDLVDHPQQVTLVRTPRRRAYRKAWQALPGSAWEHQEEPGPYTKARPKKIHLAETTTQVVAKKKGQRTRSETVRTIVVREEGERGRDRWHAIWVFHDDTTPGYELVKEFRQRQHHEQTYRIMLHDAYVDTVPSGYDKNSTNVKRPGFKKNAITLYAWMAGLATNTLDDFTRELPKRFSHAHPRTLRRWFFNTPADLFLGDHTLIVLLKPKRLKNVWKVLVDRVNTKHVRIPWMEDRKLILSLQSEEPNLSRILEK